ncbi:MAG: alpha-ketoglutarate-dependent dioxygenase AlkB [Bdellovibrionales bacterium]|nr:alpha-ketoglutarate-dependent dioxygenase AlkB [Bdellovibrionales bacterium]
MKTLKNVLPMDGTVTYIKDFFTTSESQDYFSRIRKETAWEEKSIIMFGKSVMQPRLMSWYGDPESSYKYSGLKLQPLPWTKPLIEIKEAAERASESDFNSVLLNLYRSGQDSMGAHNDNEKELGSNPCIASISFGETRRFIFRHIKTKEKVNIDLEDGSLLIMKGSTQTHWKHELPKTKKVIQERINLTFRNIVV